MIELHTFATPNGVKPAILLEELGAPYQAHRVDIMKGEQFTPEFGAISPNCTIPVIVDRKGPGGAPHAVFESGAILIYLADKYGTFLPADPVGRSNTLQWLFWQIGSVGPTIDQALHFLKRSGEDLPYAKDRYVTETKRLLQVVEARLSTSAYLAADEYTIADIATAPWFLALDGDGDGLENLLDDVPRVQEWLARILERPAVQRGRNIRFTGE